MKRYYSAVTLGNFSTRGGHKTGKCGSVHDSWLNWETRSPTKLVHVVHGPQSLQLGFCRKSPKTAD